MISDLKQSQACKGREEEARGNFGQFSNLPYLGQRQVRFVTIGGKELRRRESHFPKGGGRMTV